MAELTYSDIREAIVEALSEHDRYTARYGTAEQRIRKETKQLTKDLLESVQLGFKERKSQDKELLDKLEKKIFQDKQKTFANEDGKFGFGTKTEQAFGNFLNRSFSKLDQYADKFSKNMTLIFAQRWNAMSNEATQQVVNSIKSLNTSGIAQDWDKFTYSLRDSTIRLEDFIKATQQHNTALQILNKSTGNAAGTYQSLAKSAADFAVHQGKVAYDNEQLSDAIGSYLEMQRSTGNLDKLNRQEMQNGVNKLIVSADRLSKEFGLNRDELLKKSQKPDDNVDIALQAAGLSPEAIAEIKQRISTLETINPQLADMLKKQIATFGYDSNALAYSVGLNSKNINQANLSAQQGDFLTTARLYSSMDTMEEIAKNAPSGSFAGILNMKAGDWGSNVMKAQLNAKRALQTKGANTKTDETIISEQKYRNEVIKKNNNELALLSKSAAGARMQFSILTGTLMGVNAALSAGVWSKNLINMFAPFLSQMMGIGGGLLSVVSYASSLLNQIDSFRTISDTYSGMGGASGGRGVNRHGFIWRTRAVANKRDFAGLRKIAGKTGKARTLQMLKYNAARSPTVWGLAGAAGSALIDSYGAQGLEAVGVGKKSAKITANAASSALEGAAWGATIGSFIPVVGTIAGGLIGAAVGGIGSLAKAAFKDSEESTEQQYQRPEYDENSPTANYQRISQQQQEEMINQLRRIANGMENVDYNTNNMVKYNY